MTSSLPRQRQIISFSFLQQPLLIVTGSAICDHFAFSSFLFFLSFFYFILLNIYLKKNCCHISSFFISTFLFFHSFFSSILFLYLLLSVFFPVGVGVIIISSPLYVLVIGPLAYKYLQVQGLYRNVSKELKKIGMSTFNFCISF